MKVSRCLLGFFVALEQFLYCKKKKQKKKVRKEAKKKTFFPRFSVVLLILTRVYKKFKFVCIFIFICTKKVNFLLFAYKKNNLIYFFLIKINTETVIYIAMSLTALCCCHMLYSKLTYFFLLLFLYYWNVEFNDSFFWLKFFFLRN